MLKPLIPINETQEEQALFDEHLKKSEDQFIKGWLTPFMKNLKDSKKINIGMPIKLVRKFFNQLNTEVNKEKQPYLTTEQIDQFINKAFLGRGDLPKIRLNYSRGQYGFVVSLFYHFYSLNVHAYDTIKSDKEALKYRKLLKDNFENLGDLSKIKMHFREYRGNFGEWPITTANELELP